MSNSKNSQNVTADANAEVVATVVLTAEELAAVAAAKEELAAVAAAKKAARDAKFAKLSETGKKLFLIREQEQELKLKNAEAKKQLLADLKKEREAKRTSGNNAGGENSRTMIIGRLFREQPGKTKSFYLTESDRLFSEAHGNCELNPKSALTYYSLALPMIVAYDPTFTVAPEPVVE